MMNNYSLRKADIGKLVFPLLKAKSSKNYWGDILAVFGKTNLQYPGITTPRQKTGNFAKECCLSRRMGGGGGETSAIIWRKHRYIGIISPDNVTPTGVTHFNLWNLII